MLAAAAVFNCQAGQSERRFPVELAVLAGDARLYLAPGLSAPRRRGLAARMQSNLGSLRLLAREYAQARGGDPHSLARAVDALRRAFAAGRMPAFAATAAALAARHPLPLSGLRPEQASPRDIAAGRRIYATACRACHAYPDRRRDNPAGNLFRLARAVPERELMARLIGGVHGTPAVALHNPFSDAELAGLAAYLKGSAAPGH